MTPNLRVTLERMLIAAGWSGVRAVRKRTEKEMKTHDPRVIAFVGPLAVAIEAQRAWLMSVHHPGLQSGLVFPASPPPALAGARRRGVDELSWLRSGSWLTRLQRATPTSPTESGGPR